jgi:hypothetical protein
MTKFTDHLWSDLVREHGSTLTQAERPKPSRAAGAGVLRRPRIVAGSTLGLASLGVALTLVLSGSASSPAFAVTPHRDGSVSVTIFRRAGIDGANRKLASMGIHERLFAVSGRPGKAVRVTVFGHANSRLPHSCLQDQQTGRNVVVVFLSAAAQQAQVGSGTYTAPSNAGNTGGAPNNDTFQVVACSTTSTSTTGPGVAGNSGGS